MWQNIIFVFDLEAHQCTVNGKDSRYLGALVYFRVQTARQKFSRLKTVSKFESNKCSNGLTVFTSSVHLCPYQTHLLSSKVTKDKVSYILNFVENL